MALACLTLFGLMHIHSPSSFNAITDKDSHHYDTGSITQGVSNSKYNIPLKAPPLLMCMKNTALSRKTQHLSCLMLYYLLTCPR